VAVVLIQDKGDARRSAYNLFEALNQHKGHQGHKEEWFSLVSLVSFVFDQRWNRSMADSRNIVVTGASGGIGAALAVQLGAAGHRVALAARRERELEEVAARVGNGAIVVPTDVTRRDEVERLRDRAVEALGHVDVWVNNAGRGINKPVLELTDEDLDLMMTVNVKSALYGMQAIAPHFIARGRGQIVNISSFLSRVPFATFRSGYNAAKAALNALTANARVDLARTHPGIHVTLVMPGLVHTDFQRNALGGSPPMPVSDAQSVDAAVAAIVDAIAHPVAEIYTNPRQAAIVRSYFQDVGAFEREAAARG
jgi:short-subunit dehydrogenase